MADDRGDKEDLFEDLDKFFAPIQDVEWPGEGAVERPAETPRREPEAAVPPAAEEAEKAEEEEGADLDLGGLFTGEGEEEEEEWVAHDEALAGERPETEEAPAEEAEEPSWHDAEPSEKAAYETQELQLSTEDLQAAPAEYVGLPRGDQLEEGVAEAESPWRTPEPESEPSLEEVEAAAAHFAESIREEEVVRAEAFAAPAAAPPGSGETPFEGEPFSPEDLPGGPADVESDLLSDLEEEEAGGGGRTTVRLGGTEGLGGPSWQEPTSVEVGVDQERRRGERDMPAAFLTGVVLAAVAVGAIAIGKGPFAIVAAALVLLALGEVYGVMHRHHHQPATLVGLATGALILWGAYDKGEGAILAMFALGVIASFLWFLATPEAHRKHVLLNVGLTILPVAWIPMLGGFLVGMLKGVPDGDSTVLLVIALTIVFDTGAFGLGWFSGGTVFPPLAPTVSPKKTWEGVIGGMLLTVAVSMALVPSYVDTFEGKVLWAAGLGLVVALAATLGDLAESLVKRDLGIKDMGNVLPGHGGVLDRIDSLLFVAPAAFLYIRLVLL